MKAALALLVAFAAVFAASAAEVTLTDKDFESQITNGEGWFVKFYAPWCGHCKQLAPKWTELAGRAFSKPVHIASVDCTVEKDTCSAQGIRGYPTLAYFKGGSKEAIKYSGARDVEALAAFAESQ